MKRRTLLLVFVLAIFAAACSEDNVFSLEVGDCFDDEAAPGTEAVEISSVPIVECDQPHDNEVFAVFDLPDGDFPGQAAVETSALDGCIERFEPYVGQPYETSLLEVYPIYPSSGSWDQGDQEVVCALYDSSLAKLTGLQVAGS